MWTVAVTGASAGIGRAIAVALSTEGARVGLIARSATALETVKAEIENSGGQAMILPCDVAESAALEDAADRLEDSFGPLDIWINCAMVTIFSELKDIRPEEYRRVTDVTYHGCVYGTMTALRRMLPRGKGHIIQVGSALSYRAIPLQSAYCGAKHAIRGFTASLRSELIHNRVPIELSIVHLPAFNTPQFVWARNHMKQNPQPLPPIHDPSLAAEAVLWTARNPQREVWVGWPTWKAIIGNKLLPGFLDRYTASIAWEGQFADGRPEPGRADNLFDTVDELHSRDGPFGNRTVTRKPRLWHVKNHNFWINGAALIVLFGVFLLGLIAGSN